MYCGLTLQRFGSCILELADLMCKNPTFEPTNVGPYAEDSCIETVRDLELYTNISKNFYTTWGANILHRRTTGLKLHF